jgi:hypothetical protein
MTKNPYARLRDRSKPYEIWKTRGGAFEWRVLKKYKPDDDAAGARWYCAVKTPATQDTYEYGDVDPDMVRPIARRVFMEPAVDTAQCGLPPVEPFLVAEYFPHLVAPGKGKPGVLSEYLSQYFTEPGMSLHGTDLTGDVKFFSWLPCGECEGAIAAGWEMRLERTGPGALRLVLAVADDPEHPLQVPFLFDCGESGHRFDLVRFLQQNLTSFYILTKTDGDLEVFGRRNMLLDSALRMEMALQAAVIMAEVKGES